MVAGQLTGNPDKRQGCNMASEAWTSGRKFVTIWTEFLPWEIPVFATKAFN